MKTFYLLSFSIIILRIAFFSLIVNFLQDAEGKALIPPNAIGNIDNFATYTELLLGIQQLSSMIELNLMLRYSSFYKVFDLETIKQKRKRIFKTMKLYRCVAVIISLLFVLLVSILTFMELSFHF